MAGVVLLHAWWGRTPWFVALGGRLADAGFEVAVPDLYGDGRTTDSVEEAEALSDALEVGAMMARVEEARRSLDGDVTVVGFSLGAFAAVQLLARDPTVRAAVLYYGTWTPPADVAVTARVLGHFAELDPFEPLDDVRRLEQRLPSAEFHVYPGTRHWFAEPDRPEYDPGAADLAWSRTLAFLRG